MDRTDDVLEKCRVFCIRRRHEGSERANEGGSELNCTVPFPCGGWLVGWSRKRQVHLGRGSVVIVHAAAAGRRDGWIDGRALGGGRRTKCLLIVVQRRRRRRRWWLHPAGTLPKETIHKSSHANFSHLQIPSFLVTVPFTQPISSIGIVKF